MEIADVDVHDEKRGFHCEQEALSLTEQVRQPGSHGVIEISKSRNPHDLILGVLARVDVIMKVTVGLL